MQCIRIGAIASLSIKKRLLAYNKSLPECRKYILIYFECILIFDVYNTIYIIYFFPPILSGLAARKNFWSRLHCNKVKALVMVCLFHFYLRNFCVMASNGNCSPNQVLWQINLMKWPFYWNMLRVNITEFTFFSAILNSVYDGWVLPKGRYILRSFRLFICHLQFIFKDNGS